MSFEDPERTTCPTSDATCAVKLADAGTVLMGKTGDARVRRWRPVVRSAVAAGAQSVEHRTFHRRIVERHRCRRRGRLILGGIGTDTGGSIRGPAALCGIAGIKPTYGLVSRAGVAPAAFTLDHIGPMAWTAEDCAIMLQALAGHDPADPASASRPMPNYTEKLGAGIKGMRIGVIHHFHETDHKVDACRAARHRCGDRDLPRAWRGGPRGDAVANAGMARLRHADLDHRTRLRL